MMNRSKKTKFNDSAFGGRVGADGDIDIDVH
jgi:hypothetical protein